MDVLSFIASVVGSVAWPAAAVMVVFVFRESIAKLLPELHKLKYKDMELEFGKRIAEVKQELEDRPKPKELPEHAKGEAPPEPGGTTAYYRSLAEVSPRAAILEAWLGFELVANSAIKRLQPGPRLRMASMSQLFEVLAEAELLTRTEVDALTRLRGLRNQVVHGPEPDLSIELVAEYASLVQTIADDVQHRLDARFAKPAPA
jgi:hypothetical protein